MSITEFSSIEEAAQMYTEQFVLGLDAGIEVAGQYKEAGATIDLAADSDAFHLASNRVLTHNREEIKDYTRIDFEVMRMGIIAALDKAARAQGVEI